MKVTISKYDDLGRLDTLIIDTTVTVYNYGKSGCELLQLVKKQTGDNYQEYSYDTYGHIISENRQIAGTGMLAFAYTYNAMGQLSKITYPGNLAINRQYDACGNLEKVSTDTQSIWELTGYSGTVTTARLGGTLTATETHNSQGLLTNLKTLKDSEVLHNMNFIFDGATGNLTSRSGMLDQTESFTYDNLDRLTFVKEGSTDVMQMGYATNGNISSKTGVGTYTYFESKPHAVVGIENTGNLISKSTQSTIFNEFGKIKSISDAGSGYRLDFTYGPDQERWKTVLKQNNISVKTSIFAGDYEQITKNGVTTRLYYLDGGAIYVKQDGLDDKVYYTCADHLGSIVKLIDGNGTEVFKASYDAWGKQTITNNTFAFHRGYTGHEHLPEFDLINMNGRLYDPILGRFLSPDPFVQMPDLSQNFNRYSYCLNNPLKYTDPDGEIFWTIFNGIKNFLRNTFVKSWSQGINAWTNGDNWHSTKMAWKLDAGLFKGNFKQILSRFTWELPQTFLGYQVSHFHNLFDGVKSVTYYGGATAVESYSENWKGLGLGTTTGFTLGSYINGVRGLEARPDKPLFQHEYGHYRQSQSSGWFYMSKYAIPSALSSGKHGQNPVEQDANVRALEYFNNRIENFRGWDFSINKINGYNSSLPYNHKDNQLALKKAKLGFSWYDWVMAPMNVLNPLPIIPGLVNTIIFNNKH